MLRVIYGADTFTGREKLREVLSAYSSGTVESDNVQWIEGKTATPAVILDACEQVTMFATTSVVVVEGLLARFSKDESRRKPAKVKKRNVKADSMGEWEGFSERVRSLPETSVLILLDGELKGTNALLDSFSLTPDEVAEYPALRPDAVVRWVRERVANRGGVIDGEAASRLSALVGADLWLLNSEIEKLVLYADGAPIGAGTVDNLAASAVAPSIFMIVDAIVEHNAPLARRRLDDMYNKGLSAGYVFTMLARQFRIIAQIKEARQHRGAPLAAPDLERLHSFALQRATRQAERYTEARLRHAFQCLAAADRAIKTGLYTDRMALDMFVTELLNPPTTRPK